MIYDFDPLYSAYPQHRNQTLKFLPSDTEYLYYSNMKDLDKSYKLLKNGWYDKEIDYTFNSYGFRSDEFEDPSIPSILFLGCSCTVGIGIRMEDSFTSIVSKELGLKNYNLAWGGGSADAAFRIGQYWIPKLKPDIVFFVNLFKTRSEIIFKFGEIQQITHSKNKPLNVDNAYWEINNLRNICALKHICNTHNLKLYNFNEFEKLDYARDLRHPGKLSNKYVAEEILNQIQNRGD